MSAPTASAAKRAKKTTATPSPRVLLRPTPSPNMGKLQIGGMAPPAPKATPWSGGSASSAPAASPGEDLLFEAMGLNHDAAMPRASRAPPPAAASSSSSAPLALQGTAVDRLPEDMALKKGCHVTSCSSLRWCTEVSTSAHDDALRCAPGMAGRTAAVRLQQALTCWRHPSQRLPPVLTKDLNAASTDPATRAFVDSVRDAWDIALRGLYFALRSGRVPYFYCRGQAFTIVWRNRVALEGDDGFGLLPPVAWQTDDSIDSCCAVLCPSTRAFRAHLRNDGVPFEMPAAAGRSADDTIGLDGEVTSALLFSGHEALHSLYEFLLNSSSTYQLSLMLLAPQPFRAPNAPTPTATPTAKHDASGTGSAWGVHGECVGSAWGVLALQGSPSTPSTPHLAPYALLTRLSHAPRSRARLGALPSQPTGRPCSRSWSTARSCIAVRAAAARAQRRASKSRASTAAAPSCCQRWCAG